MAERDLTPEEQKVLPEVVQHVSDLYIGEMMGRHVYKEMDFGKHNELWEKVAQEYPAFTEIIRDFWVKFKEVEKIRQVQHSAIIRILANFFVNIEDDFARKFLTDVLLSRIRGNRGARNSAIVPIRQVDAMAFELAFSNKFEGNDANQKLGWFIEAILTERLVLDAPQVNPELIDTNMNTHISQLEVVDLGEGIGTVPVFTDDRIKELNLEFDPKSYRGMLSSAYGDASLEQVLSPLVALGNAHEAFVGIDKKDIGKITQWANGYPMIIRESLPDIRIMKFGGREICFPTAQLLENFGISKIAENQ